MKLKGKTQMDVDKEKKEKEKKEKQSKAVDYLKSTDWYLMRKCEQGIPVPDDIIQKRAKARIDAEGYNAGK